MNSRITVFLNEISRRIGAPLAVAVLLSGAVAAHASCRMPQLGTRVQTQLPQPKSPAKQGGDDQRSIVGLWHVAYTDSTGQFFLESLDQWHSDGNEIESANADPVEGNICMGVWKGAGPNTVSLHHIGWTFDAAGNSTGYFTIDETDTVAEDGQSYQGAFDFKVYDANSDLQAEVRGTLAATRINP